MKQSLFRYLQGEDPGMSAGGSPPPMGEHLAAVLYPDSFYFTTIAILNMVLLADVSFWQEDIDWQKMKGAGLAGAIIRAGQRNWPDTKFRANWTRANAVGLPRGSYFLYDSRESPRTQAALWWDQIRGDTGELVHVADLEESYGGPFGKTEHFKEFLQEFQRLSGLPDERIAIYTGYYWWLARVGPDPYFKRFPLWLAWYAAMSVVRVPPPWNEADLLFWQYTSSGDGSLYGVGSREIDLNWFCCSLAAFQARFHLGGSMPEPNYLYSITPLFTNGSSVRPEPDTGNTKLTIGLPYGRYAYGNRRITIAEDKYEGTQVNRAGDVWLEVLEVDGVQLPAPAYIAEIHLGQRVAIINQIGTVPEPDPGTTPTLPDLPYTITLGDDITYTKATISGILKPK